MISLSYTSISRLETCHPKIQRLIREVALRIPRRLDFTVLCGHRGEIEQHQAFRDGTSKVDWPNSKHNELPSRAVDLAPYPVDWNDPQRFCVLAGYVLAVADDLGLRVRWLGDPDGDGKIRGQTFTDLPHFELATEE